MLLLVFALTLLFTTGQMAVLKRAPTTGIVDIIQDHLTLRGIRWLTDLVDTTTKGHIIIVPTTTGRGAVVITQGHR